MAAKLIADNRPMTVALATSEPPVFVVFAGEAGEAGTAGDETGPDAAVTGTSDIIVAAKQPG